MDIPKDAESVGTKEFQRPAGSRQRRLGETSAQCVDHIDDFAVVDFFGTEAAGFVGVVANGRADVRAICTA